LVFPGEDEKDFKILYDFVRKYEFDRLGVFTYSREEGTPAYDLKPQIKKSVKESRRNDIMQLQKEIVQRKMKADWKKYIKLWWKGCPKTVFSITEELMLKLPTLTVQFTLPVQSLLNLGEFVNVKY